MIDIWRKNHIINRIGVALQQHFKKFFFDHVASLNQNEKRNFQNKLYVKSS